MSAEPFGKNDILRRCVSPRCETGRYRRCWKDRRPNLALGPCSGRPSGVCGSYNWRFKTEIPAKVESEIP